MLNLQASVQPAFAKGSVIACGGKGNSLRESVRSLTLWSFVDQEILKGDLDSRGIRRQSLFEVPKSSALTKMNKGVSQSINLDQYRGTAANDHSIVPLRIDREEPRNMSSSVETPRSLATRSDMSLEPSTDRSHIDHSVDFKQPSVDEKDAEPESMRAFFLQSLIPFLIAGAGLIGSGVFLTYATTWKFVRAYCEVIVLLPSLLGLKGNLEMNFSSRLSTMANMGAIDNNKVLWKLIYTNTALLQLQSVLLSLFACVAVFGARFAIEYKFDADAVILITSAAVVSASISSIIMVCIMSTVVYFSRLCGINPDNVTAPLAASLGDFVAISTFLGVGTFLLQFSGNTSKYLSFGLLVTVLLFCPLWMFITGCEASNFDAVKFGWWAPMIAIIFCCGSGFVLGAGMGRYPGIEAFSPLIAGLAGNRCAVQASRISTSLHTSRFPMGTLPSHNLLAYVNPIRAFFSKDTDSRAAQILVTSSVPGQLLFVSILFLATPKLTWNIPFIAAYLLASFSQIVLLLYFTQLLVRMLWRMRIDPDHSAIPLITSIGDVLGNSLLLAAFAALQILSRSSVWLDNKELKADAMKMC
ncbi:hypothetical protein QR680_007133 [Steinernema hermaphroditum]|uniref:SLC41A/MgtE integral membrane domain-containing protein n=1 Tax=Steinernema hermaphroditum TaxID=289476 RepID=A0AA39I0A9_9BILA|nr:hypothetical protein QR680_007133 [Steinernema hermaphroditum]